MGRKKRLFFHKLRSPVLFIFQSFFYLCGIININNKIKSLNNNIPCRWVHLILALVRASPTFPTPTKLRFEKIDVTTCRMYNFMAARCQRASRSKRRACILLPLILLLTFDFFSEKTPGITKTFTKTTTVGNSSDLRPRVRVFVSYVYFESQDLPPCELHNKRINFAFFLVNAAFSGSDIVFNIAYPGQLPTAEELCSTIGASLYTDTCKTIFQAFAEMNFVASDQTNRPDLCVHQASIRSRGDVLSFDYFMILNDGVRGPFFDKSESEVRALFRYPFPSNSISDA